jgi:hypothetical protein
MLSGTTPLKKPGPMGPSVVTVASLQLKQNYQFVQAVRHNSVFLFPVEKCSSLKFMQILCKANLVSCDLFPDNNPSTES